jgi:hypothetical protein
MARIFNGRYTAHVDGPFVVFLIGMRINRLWAIHKWLPVAMAMGPMLRTLYQHPEKGFLGQRTFVNGREVASIQYWRSFDALEAFARAKDDPHLAAWQRFNKAVGGNGAVGIWHETYAVAAGDYESLYANMPRVGLAQAGDH